MKSNQTDSIAGLITLSQVYFTLLLVWLTLYLLFGDHYSYLALINIFAQYFFIPLPLAGWIALRTRRKELITGTLLGIFIFSTLWGRYFVPKIRPTQPAPTLRVMTYNVLGIHDFTTPLVEVVRASNADVIFFQELNLTAKAAIRAELSETYPYQLFDSADGIPGMGTISRYPLEPTGQLLPLQWVGTPQIMRLTWQQQSITLVNFHTHPPAYYPPDYVTANFRHREAQGQALANFAAQTPGALILGGDANTVPLSTAYKNITAGRLKDGFAEAGWGWGHTYPGDTRIASNRFTIAGVKGPTWLVRIDYIFVSDEWEVISAQTAPADGVSDHRGVIVEVRSQK